MSLVEAEEGRTVESLRRVGATARHVWAIVGTFERGGGSVHPIVRSVSEMHGTRLVPLPVLLERARAHEPAYSEEEVLAALVVLHAEGLVALAADKRDAERRVQEFINEVGF